MASELEVQWVLLIDRRPWGCALATWQGRDFRTCISERRRFGSSPKRYILSRTEADNCQIAGHCYVVCMTAHAGVGDKTTICWVLIKGKASYILQLSQWSCKDAMVMYLLPWLQQPVAPALLAKLTQLQS